MFLPSIDRRDEESAASRYRSRFQEVFFSAKGVIYCVGFRVSVFEGFGYSATPGALDVASVY